MHHRAVLCENGSGDSASACTVWKREWRQCISVPFCVKNAHWYRQVDNGGLCDDWMKKVEVD